jgi:hypothetical protein
MGENVGEGISERYWSRAGSDKIGEFLEKISSLDTG